MTFLPIVERELRIASRRNATFRLRILGAVIGLGVTGWRLFSLDQVVQSQQGRTLFLLLITMAFIYSLFAGMALTADCLSAEKREGTLGLVFLTDIKSHDVILGKLAANSLGATYGMLAILPVLAISLTFGGVTGTEYFRAAVLLANTLLFSLATGLLLSAFCQHERKAFVGAFFVIFLLIVGPLMISFALSMDARFRGPEAVAAVMQFSPAYSFLCLRFSALPFPTHFFWWSLLWIHFLSWTFLAVAGHVQKRGWQDRPQPEKQSRWRKLKQSVVFGATESRTAFRRRLLDIAPLLWFNARNRLKPASVWFFLICMGLLWIWDCWQLGPFMWEADNCLVAVLILHSMLKIWVGIESCARFADDQRSGALELLLTTPLRKTEFFEAHFRTLKRQFALPILAVLAFDMLVLGRVQPAKGFWNSGLLESLPVIHFALVTAMILLVVDSFALCWVGVWNGLFSRSTNRALAATLAKVLILPSVIVMGLWGLWGLVLVFADVFVSPPFMRQNPAWAGLFVMSWLIVGMVAGVSLRIRSRKRLDREFRAVVSERFQEREDRGKPERRTPQPTAFGEPVVSSSLSGKY